MATHGPWQPIKRSGRVLDTVNCRVTVHEDSTENAAGLAAFRQSAPRSVRPSMGSLGYTRSSQNEAEVAYTTARRGRPRIRWFEAIAIGGCGSFCTVARHLVVMPRHVVRRVRRAVDRWSGAV